MVNPQLSMDAVDFRYILLDTYKKIGIPESELAVILMVDHLLRQENTFITADLLSLKMTMKTKEIDAILASLVKKEYISYDVSPEGMRTSLEPLKRKLYNQFQLEMAKNSENLLSAQRAETLTRLYGYFEKRLKRTLSPLENDLISSWLDDGYEEEDIQGALEEALFNNRRSMKSVDKMLRTGRRRSDIEKEGYSGVNDTWDKDIEKTIEIAKTKWIEDE